nr:hypothetical protein [Brucella intermedia]
MVQDLGASLAHPRAAFARRHQKRNYRPGIRAQHAA